MKKMEIDEAISLKVKPAKRNEGAAEAEKEEVNAANCFCTSNRDRGERREEAGKNYSKASKKANHVSLGGELECVRRDEAKGKSCARLHRCVHSRKCVFICSSRTLSIIHVETKVTENVLRSYFSRIDGRREQKQHEHRNRNNNNIEGGDGIHRRGCGCGGSEGWKVVAVVGCGTRALRMRRRST